MTDVTIRGIDDEVYSKFAAKAKRRGIAIGELTTQVMRAMASEEAESAYVIRDQEELSVSKADLMSLDGMVRFSNIEKLRFEDDVDWEVFKAKVEGLDNIEVVTLPKSLSKFQVLTRARNVERFSKG
ncbi:MAG: hypothetical protein MUE65_03180 [Methanomassiliicoccales archaeon]|jgi:hypothetical protein|nr:hypothetical protein [Methanomassiliicoccales archaeon]